MSYGLGVDLGTTLTAVAVGVQGQTRISTVCDDVSAVPTAQALQPDGDLLVRAGTGVVRGVNEPWLAEPVPLVLGGRPHCGVPALVSTLRSTLEAVTAAEGETPERVVLTCPAVWGPVRRQQFGEVSRQVGLHSVTVVSEPEAATAFFVATGRLVEADVVAVYDIGAVTVDLTIVRVTESGTEILGQPEALEGVGGVDFDDVVLAHVDRALGGALSGLNLNDPRALAVLEDARAECVRAKEALSWAEFATVDVALPVGLVRVGLSRGEFESMIRASLESTLDRLRRSMRSAGVGVAGLAGVVLVGGSSRIPLVERMLAHGLGRSVLVHEHPRHCVALGAAAIAEGISPPVHTPDVVHVTGPRAPLTPHRHWLLAVGVAAALLLLLAWGIHVTVPPQALPGGGEGSRSAPGDARPSAGAVDGDEADQQVDQPVRADAQPDETLAPGAVTHVADPANAGGADGASTDAGEHEVVRGRDADLVHGERQSDGQSGDGGGEGRDGMKTVGQVQSSD